MPSSRGSAVPVLEGLCCVGCGCDDPRVLLDFRLGEHALPLCHNCCHLVRSTGVTTRGGIAEVVGRDRRAKGAGRRRGLEARRGTIADRYATRRSEAVRPARNRAP